MFVFSGDPFWLDELEEFTLVNPKNPEQKRTFVIESTRPHKKGFIVKTPEVKDRTAAEAIAGWEFYIDADFFVSEPGETIFLSEIEGFSVHAAERGLLGVIQGFLEVPGQDLLIVQGEKFRYEIPFVDAFVERIDHERREIHMKLPEGLLELFEEGPA